MSSEDWLLNESHRPHHGNPNDDDVGDGDSVDSGGSFLDGPSPEHLGMELPDPPRSLTYINGLAVTMGLQVGAGIFSTPAAVRTNVSTSATALSVWALAGLLVWTGAACFIELGTRIPYNGGMQEYLRHCYGDVYGFLFAWAWILLSRPCAVAMVALVFSEYLFKTLLPDHDVDVWVLNGVALLAITSITLLNFIGTNVGASAANFFLVLKVFALSTIAVAGVVFAVSDFAQVQAMFPPATPDPGDSSLWADVGGFTDAILASLFAYGGCDSLGFIVGEMKDPRRTLPRVVHSSMAMVMALFVSSSFAFYHELSKDVLQKTNAVAVLCQAFGREILGEPGAWFYALMVCLCSLGSLNALVFSASRLTQAAGARNYLPAFLGTADSAGGKSRNGPTQGSTGSFCAGRCCYQSQTKNQNLPA
ncbi:MAG: hypothetical protein M1839_003702 [Geoglossum umbratile]|nr:MAG: hypothetical protein M1839_003702 [Geoglossum umbratile]